MPLSGLLSEYGFDGGWPSIFYVFGFVGVIWSVAFLIFVYEDPTTHPNIKEKEKKYIISALWGTSGVSVSSLFDCLVHNNSLMENRNVSKFKSYSIMN